LKIRSAPFDIPAVGRQLIAGEKRLKSCHKTNFNYFANMYRAVLAAACVAAASAFAPSAILPTSSARGMIRWLL